MMVLLDRVCMGRWFNKREGIGKGSGVWLREKEEGDGPNRTTKGDY